MNNGGKCVFEWMWINSMKKGFISLNNDRFEKGILRNILFFSSQNESDFAIFKWLAYICQNSCKQSRIHPCQHQGSRNRGAQKGVCRHWRDKYKCVPSSIQIDRQDIFANLQVRGDLVSTAHHAAHWAAWCNIKEMPKKKRQDISLICSLVCQQLIVKYRPKKLSCPPCSNHKSHFLGDRSESESTN